MSFLSLMMFSKIEILLVLNKQNEKFAIVSSHPDLVLLTTVTFILSFFNQLEMF